MEKKPEDKLAELMDRLGVKEEDLTEKFILGSGSGGQKIQKTSSCVYLKHLPSGVEIKCQQTRSREQNRFLARWELCQRLKVQRDKARQEAKKKRHTIAQARRPRSKAKKEKMLEGKRRRSQKKSMRKPPSRSDD